MGHDIRVTAPPTCDRTWDADPAAPSAPVSPSEFWDNVTIPLSAYLPAPQDGSPDHRTPPPVSPYTQHRGAPHVWDQPVTTWQPALEPVPVEEPVASGSTLPVPNDSSYWSNVIEQRGPTGRPQLHRRRWGRIDRQLTAEPRPPPELLVPPESRYYEYFTDETVERVPSRSFLDPPCHSDARPPHPDGRSTPDLDLRVDVPSTNPYQRWICLNPSDFTREQLQILASPSQEDKDELRIASFTIIMLMNYPSFWLGDRPKLGMIIL